MFTSTDLLYANLTAQLTDAVDMGYFTTTLNSISLELGATVTLRATALEITHSEEDVIYPSSSDQSNSSNSTAQGLSPGAVVGLIFGLLAGVCFMGTVIHKQSTVESSSANKFQQLAPTLNPLHAHHSRVEDQGAAAGATAIDDDNDYDDSHTKSPLHHDLSI